MKKIISFSIVFLTALHSWAATNFLDLAKSTTRQSQWVQQFDSKTKQGGGFFKYYSTSNVGITDIAGYQIKVSGSATGYYKRTDPVNQFNVVWCGAMNTPSPTTLAANGWTQGAADAMWGVGLTDVTVDTYDRTAWAYAMKLMETFGFQVINGEPRNYYFNPRDIQLPVYYAGSPYEENKFIINYNGAHFFATTNSLTHTFFKRVPPSNGDALTFYMRARFIITMGNFYGKGDGSAIDLGASYTTSINDCFFDSLEYGITVKFCLNPSLERNNFIRVKNPIR